MTNNKLIESIIEIYKKSLKTRRDSSLDRSCDYKMKDILNFGLKETEYNNKKGLSFLNEALKEYVNSSTEAIRNVKESLSLPDEKETLEVATDDYIKAVKNFTESGNKGFYDIGSNLTIRYESDIKEVEKLIERLQNDGIDIKVINAIEYANPENSRFGTSMVMSVIMPSSQYGDFEKIFHSNFPQSQESNDLSRENYFIPPTILRRNEIDNTLDSLKTIKDTGDRYDFNALGYFTYKIDTFGGYGVFDETRPDQRYLRESINSSLSILEMMSTSYVHSNKAMRTNLFYHKHETDGYGITNVPEKGLRINLITDLEAINNLNEPKSINKQKNKI